MNFVTRINLNTDCENRNELIDFCLNSKEQYLAIGWSGVYTNDCYEIVDYKSYYYAVKEVCHKNKKRISSVLNVFWYADVDDLFWTRDTDGNYWICRAKGKARTYYSQKMDVGAILPVEAYKVGLEVPGQIKAAFNTANGGTSRKLTDKVVINYSAFVYNKCSHADKYEVVKKSGSLLDNLPDFELEELVISYLQVKENYYVLSNSIANNSTTIKIECELITRDKTNFRKAVLQVKGGTTKEINADDGYIVYLYAPKILNIENNKSYVEISRNDLVDFYDEYKTILPNSITMWENLFE